MFRFAEAGRLAALAAMLVPSLAAAHSFKAGTLLITHPWTRATPNGAAVAGGYMTITNQGTAADTLTGATFAAATAAAIHDMATTDGVMTMRPAGPATIPPGGSLTLSPAGTHVMFTGLTHGLRKGDSVPGTLSFEHAGTVPVSFAVEAIGVRTPADQHEMPGMDMH